MESNLDMASDVLGQNRILYGAGGGYGYGNGQGLAAGNSVLAAEAHANGTASSAKADCNATRFSDGLNSLSSQFDNQTRTSQFDSVNKSITDAEFRSQDRLRDVERMVTDNAKDAASCCCDAKLQSCEDKSQILAAIAAQTAVTLAVEGRAVERSLNAANAELTALKTQIACGCCTPSS